MDPFLDLIQLLRPQATRWAGIDAHGRWGLSFRQRNDLLFCQVERGACELIRPGLEPVTLQAQDFALIRTSTPFRLASDAAADVLDSERVVATTGSTAIQLGSGRGARTVLRGGRFIFDTANEHLLTGLLPQVVHVPADDTSSAQVRALLAMNEGETKSPGPGSDFIVARLMELLLVEILRSRTIGTTGGQKGLLAGLADPVTARALAAMHDGVSQQWTTGRLARMCGTSRSAFGLRFSKVVGTGPIEYLQQWRMALAMDELRRGTRSVSEIALRIGFQSGSAFTTAFTRAVGCSPRQFAQRAGRNGEAVQEQN